MKVCLLFAVLTLLQGVDAFGQSATQPVKPTATPPTEDVVKISTNLIRIDVSVTDAKGKPVTDLRNNEIEIFENGQKQAITTFSFVSSARTAPQPTLKPVDKKTDISVPPPTASTRPGDVRRTIALVVDDLSLSFESVYFTKRALRKFVDEQMQEGDLVAVIRTGAGIGALQQFTTDKRLLQLAIEKVKWNPMGTGGASAFAPIASSPLEMLRAAGDTTISDEDIAEEKRAEDRINDYRGGQFASGTLGALNYVIGGMSELPGRKSVMLFSDGFKLTERDREGTDVPSPIMPFLRQLIDAANRMSVVFYAIDPRGLQYTGLTAADSVTTADPNVLNSKLSERRDQLFDSQAGLAILAEGTGGFVVKNNNDLNEGVRRVLDDQSYYLIGYEPDSETFDPANRKFNSITVKVLRKGVDVRYRSGFFNVPETKRGPVKESVTPLQRIEKALYSPFTINDISLRLNTLFGSDATNTSFVRSLLHIDASNLMFTDEKDGTKRAVFSVLAASFGENGAIVDQLGKTYTMTVPADLYKKVLSDGIVYHFKFPIKRPGAYQYRVAIRDSQGEKVGSASQFIEVPDLKKNQLALSSLVIENMTVEEWNRGYDLMAPLVPTNPMSDTALRRVVSGSVLRWGLEIYNAKLNESKLPKLTTRVRVFREGKMVLDGIEKPFELSGQTDMTHLKTFGAISIGKLMEPGDYILQVIVADGAAKTKHRFASQFVQFEVVDR